LFKVELYNYKEINFSIEFNNLMEQRIKESALCKLKSKKDLKLIESLPSVMQIMYNFFKIKALM